MDLTTEMALRQLDDVIAEFESRKGGSNAEQTGLLIARMRAAITRLAPPRSVYLTEAKTDNYFSILGVVKALRADYAAGYMQSYRQLINADLFSDFLGMAEYLLQEEQLKQPAAVVAGGVLEEHVRKLCDQFGVSTTIQEGSKTKPKKIDVMNADLAKANAYGRNDQKQVTAWCGIRNSAAHAKYDEFDESQVRMMIAGIRDFVSRFPG